jgi:hypothetical protein
MSAAKIANIPDLLNRRPFVTEFILEKREVLTLHSS